MENKKCYCPIVDREIDAMDCFDAALVFEEMSPQSELPDYMKFTDRNQETCLKCQYHPQ